MRRVVCFFMLLVMACLSGCYPYYSKNIKHHEQMEIGSYKEITVPKVKDFVSKGLIFVESKVTIDVNGERTGSEITNEMLMRAAAEVGADDVINVKIDEIEDHKVVDAYDSKGNFIERYYKQKNYIYKASGLAIKYTNTITVNDSSKGNYIVEVAKEKENCYVGVAKDIDFKKHTDIQKIKNKEKNVKVATISNSNSDLIFKFGIGIDGKSKIKDTDIDNYNRGRISFEADYVYWFDKFGLGAGVSIDEINSWKECYSYYNDYYYYPDIESKNELIFNAYAVLSYRFNYLYLFANLGTKVGLGVGANISNFLIDLSYNKYIAYNEKAYGYGIEADKIAVSVGYKFSL